MSKLEYTPVEEIAKIHADLNRGFRSGKTKSIDYRRDQLLRLAYLLKDNKKRFQEALFADLGRPAGESNLLEIDSTIGQVKDAYDGVKKWSATERVAFSATWFPMNPSIRKEPKGVVLIIAPFNYPVLLLLGPMASAMAAGCAVVVKPSELTPATSALMAELVSTHLDQDLYRLVNGAIPETTKLLELPWNHILYTGNGRVGKIVSRAAAEHLTPVTLELGGKSAVVVDANCDLPTAARRILWGKVANAGQICLAPDYILVPRSFQDTFVAALQRTFYEFFPVDPLKAPEGTMAHIVSDAHVQRLGRLLDETHGTIAFGGQVDAARKFIVPTVVKDVKTDDALMSEEIFGPILPVVPVEGVEEAIDIINSREHPLAVYVFTKDAKFKAKVFDNTQSGAAIANEVVIHLAVDHLPFGGIGPSGSGYTTGKFGFDTFTHLRATIDNPSWVDKLLMSARYPPYDRGAIEKLNKMIAPRLPPRPGTRPSLLKRWQLWLILAIDIQESRV
ncbi:aldehyde dehydrogenase [Daedalea quercina L-15889]|uniref:Aldehyde dehydrogenase n=1 Tax=Daedalea quercina L-15889 TaxID=1314783 RepID=A0A165TKQ7_9APHY|nr:aldehyde dehydrogenase [Daedalea quercina L-15889]